MRTRAPAVIVRVMLIAGCITPAQGCSRWRVEPLPTTELVEQRRPGTVQLRRHDGERIVLRRPWVEGDSVAGLRKGDTTRVAVADVSAVAVRRFGLLETAGLAVVTVGVVFGLACALACDFGPIGFGY